LNDNTRPVENMDQQNIEPLSVMNFSSMPNLDNVFSLRKWIKWLDYEFIKAAASFHFVKESVDVTIHEFPLLDLGFIGPITSRPH
jgi:hypothetical protein